MKNRFKKIVASLITVMMLFGSSSVVLADELSITGNGADSQNSVSVTNTQTTTVEQTNNASVSNDVDSTANTGGNTASSNSGGDTNTTTGDISSNTSVENSLNVSSVEVGCCPSSAGVNISENGANSDNNISATQTNQTDILITQNAYITNNVNGSANTGNNTASNNGGNVTISTGNIHAQAGIENIGVNLASVKGSSGGSDLTISIFGNGSSSDNNVKFVHDNQTNVSINNNSYLNNILNFYANTGGNSANGNLGDVTISTGDIFLNLKIKNRTNESIVDLDCCPIGGPGPDDPGDNDDDEKDDNGDDDKKDEGDKDGDKDNDDNGDGDNGGGDSGGAGGPGEVLGASLPATGNNTVLGLTLLSLLMLAWGIYLRTNPHPKKAFVLRLRHNILDLG